VISAKHVIEKENVLHAQIKSIVEINAKNNVINVAKKVVILKDIVKNLNVQMNHMVLNVTKNANVEVIQMMELVVNLEVNAHVVNLAILERNAI
jgi:hypothetical protein